MGEVGSGSRAASAVVRLALILAMVVPLFVVTLPATAAPASNQHFLRTWERTDRAVADLTVRRTWMWGPSAFSGELAEIYLEATHGDRTVQYYDKSRMEITDPTVNPASDWFVTNGLLVVELVSGRLQVGDDAFVQLAPAEVNVAGDPDDLAGPTYATIASVADASPGVPGALYTQRLARDGSIQVDPSLAMQAVSAAVVDDVTHHAIAGPFWSFMNSAGPVWDGAGVIHDRLFENPYYATGRPISEAYWATVRVGGAPRDVLLQCFERRCLTYTPHNPVGWQVEAGNVGRHYYTWRYESGHKYTATRVDSGIEETVTHAGVSLQLPPDALDASAVVSITPSGIVAEMDGFLPTGSAWQVEIHGGRLVGTVTLALDIVSAVLPTGSDPARAQLAYLDEDSGVWVAAPTAVDRGATRASTVTTHLSIWQLFVPPGEPDDDPPTGSTPIPPPALTPTSVPNVAPMVDLNGPDTSGSNGALVVRAGAAPVALAPVATIVDPDDDVIASVVIELLDAPDGDRERIAATAAPSVIVNSDRSGHRLQLSGPAALAALQAVLRSVTYQHDGVAVTPVQRRVVIHAADMSASGSLAEVVVTVAENRPPDAPGAVVVTDEDASLPIVLAATDPDGDLLTWSVDDAPQHGSVTGVAPNLTYVPAADFHGLDEFTWSVHDGFGGVVSARVSIEIRPVNDVPVALPASMTTNEDTPVAITLGGSDVDGDSLTFDVTVKPQHGGLTGVAPYLTYTPAADFAGADTFSFTVSDGQATSAEAAVSIVVEPVDDPPSAGDLSVTTDEDQPVAVVLTGSDDGENLSFAIGDAPVHGTLSGSAPDLIYTPDPNYNGNDSFTYTASDGVTVSAAATVAIVIDPINDPPVASAQVVTLSEDGDQFLSLTGSDVDGDVVRFTITRSPTLGNVSVDGDWRCAASGTTRVCSHIVHYGTLPDVSGVDSFEFTVSDGQATSAPATVAITILPVNDPPVARDDVAMANEDSIAVPIDVLVNDTSGPDDGEVLRIASVELFSQGGSATIDAGVLLYSPAADFYGIETFRYTISDGNGGEATATVTVTVAGVNDDPTATDDTFAMDEDGDPLPLDILANDTALPDRDETLVVADFALPSHGVLLVDPATHVMSYMPDPDFFGSDSFTYTISDGNGGSATAKATITVRPVNDPPVAADDLVAIDEDSGTVTIAVLANDTFAPDVGESLVVSGVTVAALGTAAVAGDGSSIRYTPAPDAFGTDTFRYTVADDGGLTATAMVTVTIRPVNDAPVLDNLAATLTYVEDAPPLTLAPSLALTDIDSSIMSATISLISRPDGGAEDLLIGASSDAISVTVDDAIGRVTLTGSASPSDYAQLLGTLSYVNSSQAPTAGDREIQIVVNDGELVASTTLTLTVVPVNDPPLLVFGGSVLPVAGMVVLDPDATLTDVDSPDFGGGQLSATITSGYDVGDLLLVGPAGALGVSDSLLTWNDGADGIVFGQVAASERLLVITFTSAATPGRVEAVVRALAFQTTSGSAADRLISVVVSDGDAGGSETGIVTVGVNQPPDDIALSASVVAEDADPGAVIGIVSGSDPNGDLLAFSLAPSSDSRFEVLAADGVWLLRVAAGAVFDHETEASIELTLRATDPAGRSYEEVFAIAVDDVNEPPVVTGIAALAIDENSPVGTVVGQVGVADPDTGQTHTFAIIGGNDAGAFAIDAATGQITVADSGPLDYETTANFVLTVSAHDDGTPPMSGSASISIALVNLPEDVVDTEPPLVENLMYDNLTGNLRLSGGTTDGLLSSSSDPERSALTLVAVAPYDSPAFGTLAWQTDGSFTWDPPAGAKDTAGAWQITVQDAADHQTTGIVSFSIANKRVWHVDNAYLGVNRDGRWDKPFQTLHQLRDSGSAATGDIIYVASSATAYPGGIELMSGQRLIGAGAVGQGFWEVAGLPSPTRGQQIYPAIGGDSPVITNTSGSGVTLSSGNTIDGVEIGATRDAAIYGRGNSTAAGPTIRNVAISGAGSNVGPALDIVAFSGGSLIFERIEREAGQAVGSAAVVQLLDLPGASVVVDGPLNLTSTVMRGLYARGVGPVEADGAGSIELRGSVAIATVSSEGIFADSSVVRLTGVATKTVTTSGKAGVWVRKAAHFVVTNGNLQITTTGANGLDVAGSTIEMTGSGSVIGATNGIGLSLYLATIGSAGLALDSVTASGGTNGIRVEQVTSVGPLVIGPDSLDADFGAGGVIASTSGPAVLLQYTGDVTLRHLIVGAADAVVGESPSLANAVSGVGVDAYVVDGLTLDHVKVARTGSHGIAGREVSEFVMTHSQVIGAGDAVGEHGLWFDGPAALAENGMLGMSSIADSIVDGFWDTGLVVWNNPTVASSLNLTVARTTFSGNVTSGGGIFLRSEGLATITVLVEDCVFDRLNGASVDAQSVDAGVLTLTGP